MDGLVAGKLIGRGGRRSNGFSWARWHDRWRPGRRARLCGARCSGRAARRSGPVSRTVASSPGACIKSRKGGSVDCRLGCRRRRLRGYLRLRGLTALLRFARAGHCLRWCVRDCRDVWCSGTARCRRDCLQWLWRVELDDSRVAANHASGRASRRVGSLNGRPRANGGGALREGRRRQARKWRSLDVLRSDAFVSGALWQSSMMLTCRGSDRGSRCGGDFGRWSVCRCGLRGCNERLGNNGQCRLGSCGPSHRAKRPLRCRRLIRRGSGRCEQGRAHLGSRSPLSRGGRVAVLEDGR